MHTTILYSVCIIALLAVSWLRNTPCIAELRCAFCCQHDHGHHHLHYHPHSGAIVTLICRTKREEYKRKAADRAQVRDETRRHNSRRSAYPQHQHQHQHCTALHQLTKLRSSFVGLASWPQLAGWAPTLSTSRPVARHLAKNFN